MRGPCTPSERPGRATSLAASMLASALVLGACGGGGEQAAPPAPEPDTVEVAIHLTNETLGDPCTEVFPVLRRVDAEDPVRATVEVLLEGPTEAEARQGYGGWFSTDTAGMVLDVEVVDGTAHVTFADLRPVIPNASTSCGSAALLAQLDTTLLALDGIDDTRYALADRAAFYGWLQLADPDAPAPAATEPGEAGEGGEAGDEGAAGVVDLAAGWKLRTDLDRPIQPGCCGAPTTGPTSPPGPLSGEGWPADGLYAVAAARPADRPATIELTIRRWVPMDDLPEMWADIEDVIVPDASEEIRRVVDLDQLLVHLYPIAPRGDLVLEGQPGAFATLLQEGLDPAFRTWIHLPALEGMSADAIRADMLDRSADPDFPFGPPQELASEVGYPMGFRGPHGTWLRADPAWTALEPWPPGNDGLYDWRSLALELRDGVPVLHLWAGEIAG
jgi:hypothetical protein